jgi:hypothetical protein
MGLDSNMFSAAQAAHAAEILGSPNVVAMHVAGGNTLTEDPAVIAEAFARRRGLSERLLLGHVSYMATRPRARVDAGRWSRSHPHSQVISPANPEPSAGGNRASVPGPARRRQKRCQSPRSTECEVATQEEPGPDSASERDHLQLAVFEGVVIANVFAREGFCSNARRWHRVANPALQLRTA